VGCTQKDGKSKGRLIYLFLDRNNADGYASLSIDDSVVQSGAEFGASILVFKDYTFVGAPRDDAVYIYNFTSIVVYNKDDTVDYTALYVALPIVGAVFGCILLVLLFLWLFRRKPDAVEVMVLQSKQVEIGNKRQRKRKSLLPKQVKDKVYVEHYEL
jgi:hypothetical protein